MRSIGIALASLVCAFLVALPGAQAQLRFPPLTDRIVDEAQLLSPEDKAAIRQDLKTLEEKSSDQVVIYTTRSLQGWGIEDFGYQLGRAWGIGQKSTNNGVLLIVAVNDRKVRIEVGRGLEPQLTDALTRLIIENAILPAFRRGEFAAGIRAGVHDIRDVLLGDKDAVQDRLKLAPKRPVAKTNPWIPIFFFAVFFAFAIVFVLQAQSNYVKSATPGQRRRSGYVPASSDWGTGASSWGGWSSGSSGSSDSGGGFSGGGGDFGGGGSSGSW